MDTSNHPSEDSDRCIYFRSWRWKHFFSIEEQARAVAHIIGLDPQTGSEKLWVWIPLQKDNEGDSEQYSDDKVWFIYEGPQLDLDRVRIPVVRNALLDHDRSLADWEQTCIHLSVDLIDAVCTLLDMESYDAEVRPW